ncbi:MAG: (d)CMP kinase [Clostridia bacterium]|nr:(d)CMP kinase [Clostridia bacterium]
MKAIRGATTVENDTTEEIKESVKELLTEIKRRNTLKSENIICIMFSNTADIRSYYPAKAAREAGFFNCALYSSLEPDIEGSLKKCIRVMVLAETEGKIEHVYLKGAANLRKDITKKLNIAVDGPAGSGKSTVAKLIAKRFNILHLDTGAMYRAVALACMKAKVDCTDSKKVKKLLQNTKITVKFENGTQHTILNGENVSDLIRTPEISMLASTVSAHESVRTKMVEAQREIAADNSCILDGRDIGSNVLPNAEFKFYLTALSEVRAERRAKENEQKGLFQPISEVLCEIKQRDNQDKSRKIAPLVKASDAVEVDTSNMTIDEVVEFISKSIQEKI